ncbi:hypothetical protein MPC1_15980001 [Methylocella tundrae]|nr:hypothetical protein MPC1_15980001 [Methylocella tundrae]
MPESSASWRWSIPSRARAARIWAAVIKSGPMFICYYAYSIMIDGFNMNLGRFNMSLPGRLTAAGQSGVARMRLAPSSLGAPGALR